MTHPLYDIIIKCKDQDVINMVAPLAIRKHARLKNAKVFLYCLTKVQT